MKKLMKVMKSIKEFIQNSWNSLVRILENIWTKFVGFINNIGNFFKNIIGSVGDFFKKTNNIFHGKSDFNYNVDVMMSDFQYVRNVIEKTTNPLHFAALNNLVNAFERKWKPIEPNGAFGYIVRKNSDYEYAVQYLHLKLKYEYEIPAI